VREPGGFLFLAPAATEFAFLPLSPKEISPSDKFLKRITTPSENLQNTFSFTRLSCRVVQEMDGIVGHLTELPRL
jgi:hypothetical protein